MNKQERQNRIKRIIQKGRVGTQEEIKALLEEEGISVTQATLSRDLREIGLLKLRDGEGRLYYSLSNLTDSSFLEAISPFILKVACASFMLVIHTNLGEADVLANIIDAENEEGILGTIAGADTLIVICRDEAMAKNLESDIELSL